MTMYEQSQQSDWLQTELESMSLQADSPAKTSQSQDSKQEYKTERAVAYGQSAPVFLGSFDPNTPSLKTSQTCLMENGELGLSEYSGTFPRSGMMRSGTVYQLPNLARTITEIGSGLLPTPAASTGGTTDNWQPIRSSGHRAQMTLQQYVRMWPTPGTTEVKSDTLNIQNRIDKKKQIMLCHAVRMWPTPTAHNAKEGAYPAEYTRKTPTLAAQAGGALNPTWVEWLMGFPIGHTDLNA
jgi:hypothetical protein